MNKINQIVLAIREAINTAKNENPAQSVTDGFSVAIFECDDEYTAEVFFGVDYEKTVWYYESSEFDGTQENVESLLENSDGCHDELIRIADSFIDNGWIQTI